MSRTYRRTQKGKKARYLKHIEREVKEQWEKFINEHCRDENGKVVDLGLWHIAWDIFFRNNEKRDHFYWMTTPSWWNREFHTKPRRAKERNLCKKIVKGEIDLDEVVFPLHKKPHKYYW